MKNRVTYLILSLIFINLCFFTTNTIAAPISGGDSTVSTQESVSPPIDQEKAKRKKKWRWGKRNRVREVKQPTENMALAVWMQVLALVLAIGAFLSALVLFIGIAFSSWLFPGMLLLSMLAVAGFLAIILGLYFGEDGNGVDLGNGGYPDLGNGSNGNSVVVWLLILLIFILVIVFIAMIQALGTKWSSILLGVLAILLLAMILILLFVI